MRSRDSIALARALARPASILPTVAVALFLAQTAVAAVRYVDADLTTGMNDGTSWANAYRGPQSLATAMNAAISGDEVWVAAGTYKASPSSRTASHLLKAGVKVYGGFAGGEASLDERDLLANESIMSGDLLGNDGPAVSTRNDNSYHVVTCATGTTAILDGFTIRGGYANSAANNQDRGGGILCLSSQSPTVRNCRFIDNRCTFGGGAGYVNGSAPKFIACRFEANVGGSYGGAFDCAGAGAVTYERCVFLGNTAARGGALEFFLSQPRVTNCLFVENVSTGSGGGGAIWLGNSTTATLRNLTVYGNSSSATAGAIYNTGGTSTIANSIVWGNTGPGTTAQNGIRSAGGSTSTTYSCVQGGATGAGNVSADPQFEDVTTDDFRLKLSSPLIDAGANASVPAGTTEDLAGNPRFVDIASTPDTGTGTPPIVDLGAYERQVEVTPCPADLDHDGVVNAADLSRLLADWGQTGGKSGFLPADLDQDGIVNAADLSMLLAAWGECP